MNQNDKKILKTIETKPKHTSLISRITNISRTSVQYRLKKMEKEHLVKYYKNGKKTMWAPVFKLDHNKNYFKVYKGIFMYQAYAQLFKLPKNSILFTVQGAEGAKELYSILPDAFIKQAHKNFKKRGFIIKGLINENLLNIFNQMKKTTVRSHQGRTMGLKTFSGKIFSGHGEIISNSHLLLLSNPKKEQILVIKDREITRIIYEILELNFNLFEGQKSFDLNNYLNKITIH